MGLRKKVVTVLVANILLAGGTLPAKAQEKGLAAFFTGEAEYATANVIGIYPLSESGKQAPSPNTFEVFPTALSIGEIRDRMDQKFKAIENFGGFVLYGDATRRVAYPTRLEWAQGLAAYEKGQFFREDGNVKIRTPESSEYLEPSKKEDRSRLGAGEDKGRPDFFEAMVGGSVLQQYWEVGSEVSREQSDYEKYVKARYDIDHTLLTEAYFQGRLGDTHFAFAYIENRGKKRLEQSGEKFSNTYRFFSGFISLKGLVPGVEKILTRKSDLRLSVARSRTQGVATVRQPAREGVRLPDAETVERDSVQFDLAYQKYALLFFPESEGLYLGLEYSDYSMPTAVGFSDQSRQIAYADYDPDLDMKLVTAVIGMDTKNAMARSEKNLSRFFWDLELGVGVGRVRLSPAFRDKVKRQAGKEKIQNDNIVSIEAELSAGYILQGHVPENWAQGYQLLLGYKADFRGTGSYLTDEDDVGEDELYLEYSRDVLWHGPYLGANFLF